MASGVEREEALLPLADQLLHIVAVLLDGAVPHGLDGVVEGGLLGVPHVLPEPQRALELAAGLHAQSRGVQPAVVDLREAEGIGLHVIHTLPLALVQRRLPARLERLQRSHAHHLPASPQEYSCRQSLMHRSEDKKGSVVLSFARNESRKRAMFLRSARATCCRGRPSPAAPRAPPCGSGSPRAGGPPRPSSGRAATCCCQRAGELRSCRGGGRASSTCDCCSFYCSGSLLQSVRNLLYSMNDLRLLLQADKDRKIINLEFKQINNLQLMMPILSKFENLESLSLNGNRLQLLPSDMSALEKLNELDISNNLFRDAADVVGSLRTLPRLTHLMYSFKNDEEEKVVKKELPRLERLNKKPLNNTTLVSKKQKQSSSLMKLNEQDLEHIALVYDDIREMFKRSKYYVDKELAEEFDKGVDGIMGELSGKLSGAAGEEEINSSIVGCKYALVDLCFVKLITYFYHFDKGIASIVERIHDQIAEAFRSMADILRTAADRSRAEIAQVVVKKEELFRNEIKRLKAIQESHLNEISALEAKNAELLDKITKNSKSNVLETTISNIIKRKHSKSPAKGRNDPAPHDIAIKFNKALSLNQLKELIAEIYASKAKHNQICLESSTPMETLEAHMYTYLNQKYGLKPMTVEWAMSIVNGIKKYGQDDAEVAAFGKMLRNELEEDFVETLRRTKGNIRQAARKFKGEEAALISLHESEEVLLISGYKREVIDAIMARVRPEQLQEGHIPPAHLEHLVLEYQLRKHCDKIKRVGALFKSVDTDDDGIINHDQLFVLFEKLDIKHDIELEEVMQILDPFHTNSITFSHLLHHLQEIPNFKEAFLPAT